MCIPSGFSLYIIKTNQKKHCPESHIFDAILLFFLLKFSVLWAAVHVIAIYFYYFNIPQILPTLLHLQEQLRLLLWHRSSQIPALAAFLVGYSLHQYRFVKLELKMLLLVVGRHNKRNRTEFLTLLHERVDLDVFVPVHFFHAVYVSVSTNSISS